MASLLDLPHDVLLKCMYELDVNDILCAERSCASVRDTVASRHLWLVKLQGLDQSCAPDLPPHVDPNSLGYPELREIVVRAFRIYHTMTKRRSAEYSLINTIVATRPEELQYETDFRINSVKIVPGGRFLFMRCTAPKYNELRLIDLGKENTCIWSLDFGSVDKVLKNDGSKIKYGFEARSDSTITIALAMSVSFDSIDSRCYIKVLRLAPISDSVQVTTVFESELARYYELEDATFAISGSLAVLGLYFNRMIALDCERKQVIIIRLPSERLLYGPWGLQIWRDHVFYVEDFRNRKRLCAFSLAQAMELRSSSSSSFRTIELNVASISYLEPWDRNFGSSMHSMQFSIYDYPRRRDQETVAVRIIFTTNKHWPRPHFVSLRAVFDREQPSPFKWTLVGTKSATYPCEDDIPKSGAGIESGLSRSGRLLITLRGLEGSEDIVYRLVGIDREGNLVFPRLSKNITSIPIWKDDGNEDYSAELPDILARYMEPYSGNLVKLKDRGSGEDSVEIYSPA